MAAKTMAASQQSWPARAVQCPTGALIAARPRNAAPYEPTYVGCRGEHCSPVQLGGNVRLCGRMQASAPTEPKGYVSAPEGSMRRAMEKR